VTVADMVRLRRENNIMLDTLKQIAKAQDTANPLWLKHLAKTALESLK
jgi:hypothetical protein